MLSKLPSDHVIDSQFHSQQKHIKIICVGAGAAGLVTAYKAARVLRNYELIIYDKSVATEYFHSEAISDYFRSGTLKWAAHGSRTSKLSQRETVPAVMLVSAKAVRQLSRSRM